MYYIMSYNSLCGYQFNSFQDLDHLFYVNADRPYGYTEWTGLVTEAKSFATFQEARDEIVKIWQGNFLRIGIFFIDNEKMTGLPDSDRLARKVLNSRQRLFAGVARDEVTAEQLVALKNDGTNSPLNYRERRIIEIMEKM